jgi:hypothetical protein
MAGRPQRLVLLLGDPLSLDRRPIVVEGLNRADIPFSPAVVGPPVPLRGVREAAMELPELLRRYRPDAVHLSLGHSDIARRVESDGNSYTRERIPDIELHLHQIIDAAAELATSELVIATTTPVKDDQQDEIRMSDVDRLNGMIRSVAESRDILVDRVDKAVSNSILPATSHDPWPSPHIDEDGYSLNRIGQQAVANSAVRSICDVLLRAEHPWRKALRMGLSSPFEGLARPPHPELD